MDPAMEAEARERIRQMMQTSPSQRPPDFVNPLEKIEQLLTCPICLDRYKQPKLLPCQHTFCHPCLESCADSLHRILKCPECRAEHNIPYDGVKAFQTNYTLTGFLDIHLQSTPDSAAQIEEYIHRYNLERCKVCDEKADCETCAHCDRRACEECRKSHMDMLKRDMSRLVMQVKRLSNRITEASDGLSKGLELLTLNCETTRQEVQEYFQRYIRELKRREETFLSEVDTFQTTESRLMANLRDVLEIESSNMSEAVARLEAALKGECTMEDAEIVRYKNLFTEGLEYLRNFSPDADELFCKKLRFMAGDDASKLPQAIQTFGDLTVLVPQFSGRYVPLEQSYIPRSMKVGLESDYFRVRSDENARERDRANEMTSRPSSRYGNREPDLPEHSIRYRRRQQLEDEAWNRVRGVTGSSEAGRSVPGKSPWSRPPETTPAPQTSQTLTVPGNAQFSAQSSSSSTPSSSGSTTPAPVPKTPEPTPAPSPIPVPKAAPVQKAAAAPAAAPVSRPSAAPAPAPVQTPAAPVAKPQSPVSATVIATPATVVPANNPTPSVVVSQEKKEEAPRANGDEMPKTAAAMSRKPPLPRQPSSQDDSLNEKIETIRKQHEKRQSRPSSLFISDSSVDKDESDAEDRTPRARFRIRMRASSVSRQDSQEERETPIPITHYPGEDEEGNEAALLFAPKSGADEVPAWLQRRRARQMRSRTNPDIATQLTSERVKQLLLEREERLQEQTRPGDIVPVSESVVVGDTDDRGRVRSRRSSVVARDPSTERARGDYRSRGRPRLIFGRKGARDGELNWPRGVCALPGGQIAVCDSSNHRVCIFDARTGEMARSFGAYGTARGQLDSCAGIACGRGRSLIVTDRYNHRVQIFDQDGNVITVFGGHGPANGKFNNPWGVAVDDLGTIYVVDKDNHRVQMFDKNGAFVGKFGHQGSAEGQLNTPLFVAVSRINHTVYVSDSNNHRISCFDMQGQYLFSFGGEGFHGGQFKFPRGITIDNTGNVIVVDSGNNRLQVFNADGEFACAFGSWGAGAGQLKGAEDVCLLNDSLVVSDRENHRIQLF